MLRRFMAIGLATFISFAVAVRDFIVAPFLYVADRMPMLRLPTLASVADLTAPLRDQFKADRFESQYMKRAAPRGC